MEKKKRSQFTKKTKLVPIHLILCTKSTRQGKTCDLSHSTFLIFSSISSEKRKVQKSQTRLVKDLQFHFSDLGTKRGSINSRSLPFRRQSNTGWLEAHPGWRGQFCSLTTCISFFFFFFFPQVTDGCWKLSQHWATRQVADSCGGVWRGGMFCFYRPDRQPTCELEAVVGFISDPGTTDLSKGLVPR